MLMYVRQAVAQRLAGDGKLHTHGTGNGENDRAKVSPGPTVQASTMHGQRGGASHHSGDDNADDPAYWCKVLCVPCAAGMMMIHTWGSVSYMPFRECRESCDMDSRSVGEYTVTLQF